jgi:hypothetical protein
MDAVDILKVCFRRWYIMLPILVGAAGVSYQLVQAEQPTFTAYATYGLVQSDPPPRDATGEDTIPNPLGESGGALIGAALEAQLNSREAQEELGSDATRGWGPGDVKNSSSYLVEIPQFETAYEVRAWGEDEQAVREVVNRVIVAAPGIADELQDRAGAPAAGRYLPFIFAPTQVDELPSTSGMKLVVAVMGIGVLMGATWSIVADRLLRQVERRRAASRATAATGPRPPGADGQTGRPLDQPVRTASRPPIAEPVPPQPKAPQEEPPELEVQEPAMGDPGPWPDWETVAKPASGSPTREQTTSPLKSGITANGPRRPNRKAALPGRGAQQRLRRKVAGLPDRGAQQRRRTGGK